MCWHTEYETDSATFDVLQSTFLQRPLNTFLPPEQTIDQQFIRNSKNNLNNSLACFHSVMLYILAFHSFDSISHSNVCIPSAVNWSRCISFTVCNKSAVYMRVAFSLLRQFANCEHLGTISNKDNMSECAAPALPIERNGAGCGWCCWHLT